MRDEWLRQGKRGWVRLRSGEVVNFADSMTGFPAILPDDEDVPGTPGDKTSVFELVSREEELARWKSACHRRSSFSLLAQPFVDRDMPEDIFMADRVLEARGYHRFVQKGLRLLLSTGLIWNYFLWWDWMDLSFADFLFGWAINLAILGPVAAVVAWITAGFLIGLLMLGGVWGSALLTLSLGLLFATWERRQRERLLSEK